MSLYYMVISIYKSNSFRSPDSASSVFLGEVGLQMSHLKFPTKWVPYLELGALLLSPQKRDPKQPFINGCFNWMIPNLYIGNGCFTKHLGFQGPGGHPIYKHQLETLILLKGQAVRPSSVQETPAGGP